MARFKARSFLLAILLAFVVAVTGFGTAFAGTSDPYLGSYNVDMETGDATPWGTYVIDNEESYLEFYVSPTAVEGFGAPPSYFDNYDDAVAVSLDVILDAPPSITSADVYIEGAELPAGSGHWYAWVVVQLPEDGTFGSLSVRATNPGAVGDEGYINVTVVRQEAAPAQQTTIGEIETRVYIPRTDNYYGISRMTVDYRDFYETDTLRSFPTELDGLFHPYLYEKSFNTHVTNILTRLWQGLGTLVDSMTIDGTTYATAAEAGWQYRVYDARHHMIPLSEYVGADSFKLAAGDVGVWKYGAYEDPDLFPDPLPYPTSPLNE